MERQHSSTRGFSAIAATAVLAAIALFVTIGWKVQQSIQPQQPAVVAEAPKQVAIPDVKGINWQIDPQTLASTQGIDITTTLDSTSSVSAAASAKADPDGLSNIGTNVVNTLLNSYNQLQDAGTYTPEAGKQIAENVAETLRANITYQQYTAADVKAVSDTSYKRMLAYRTDMQAALQPLLKNDEPEYAIYARYIDTHDAKNLTELKTVASRYRDAIARAVKVATPQDAVSYHVEILNSLSKFATTLDALVDHADDPFASVALLRTYDDSELAVMTSFNSLATYYRTKQS